MKKLYVMIHYYRYLFVKKKAFNYSEWHFSEVTSYKIHTLIDFSFRYKSNFFVTPTPESAPSALSRSSNVFWRKTNQVIFQLDYRWPGQFNFVTFTFWIIAKKWQKVPKSYISAILCHSWVLPIETTFQKISMQCQL